MGFLKKQFRLTWRFLRTRLWKIFWGSTIAFLLICTVSTVLFGRYAQQAQAVVTSFLQQVQDSGLLDENGNIGIPALLGNNLQAAFSAAAVGVVPFLYLPALPLALNAGVIGAVLALSAAMGVPVWQTVVLGLLPHGIFEIPAILLGVSMGFYLCGAITGALRRRPGAPRLEDVLPQLVRVFLCAVLPLLAAAAVIEACLTPLLMQLAL